MKKEDAPKFYFNDICHYVEENIGDFHKKRLEGLSELKLSKVLKRKNPYLYKAKNALTANEIVSSIVDAHLSSNEETIFGDWLEGLAIFINSKTYNGRKSGIQGMDLEFDKDGVRYIVTIKSGPHWGNSGQLKRMRQDFKTATTILRTSNSKLNVQAVNGCCYGVDNKPDKGTHFKYCGQVFWTFISGMPSLYVDIIEPLGYKAKEKNEAFMAEYSRVKNKFTREFIEEFCNEKGDIDWDKLVKFNSEKKEKIVKSMSAIKPKKTASKSKKEKKGAKIRSKQNKD